uniref:Uncharacterized protein n=1 Tax=uncultured marine virus TaxID=186617 RepID=A0A0F7L624_9VIRU|nr:hypothetical protein [uncultured marine virus]
MEAIAAAVATSAPTAAATSTALAGNVGIAALQTVATQSVVSTGLLSTALGVGGTLLKGLTAINTVSQLFNPAIQGFQNEEIANLNAEQTNLDVQQKLLQGRETSVRALETLNQQSAHNIAAGFGSGIGLSPSVATSIDAISRKFTFNDTLSRTTNILQAGSLQRKGDLQRAQGQTAKKQGILSTADKALTLFNNEGSFG